MTSFAGSKDSDNKIADNETYVQQQYDKCVRIINKALEKNDYEKAMAGISVCSSLLYLWNQKYTDQFLEESIKIVADNTVTAGVVSLKKRKDDGPILFYDNFGLDTRGLALIYIKALVATGRQIIYLTTSKGENNQPEIDKALNASENAVKLYFNKYDSYKKKLKELQQVITTYKPSHAFLYTTPDDSAGIAVFTQMEGKVKRFQINLTDHAYWLGLNAFDYCIEFRDYGASVSVNYRGIDKDKEILLPYYPVIDSEAEFQGFPFDPSGKQVVFSGGALYKTIDENLTYYHMVSDILEKNPNVIFLYAGSGDSSHIEKLQRKYKNRVYFIAERKDLFQLMQHVTLYLNTYPMLGGLMMQYAVIAGKLPLTVKHGNDADGILINQHSREIEYDSCEKLIKDVHKLLLDESYLNAREEELKDSILSEEQFNEEVELLLEKGSTSFIPQITEIDTRAFREDYKKRFSKIDFENVIASRANRSLATDYSGSYVRKIIGGWRRLLGR